MKILHVTPYYIPAFSYGGPVRSVSAMVREQVLLGNNVHVATSDVLDAKTRYKGPFQTSIDGAYVNYFKNFSNYLAHRYNIYLPFKFFVWFLSNHKNFEVVHLQSFFNPMNLFVLILSRWSKFKCYLSPRGSFEPCRLSLFKRIVILLYKVIMPVSVTFVALTEDEKLSIEGLGFKNNISIVPNGVILPENKRDIDVVQLKKQFGIPKEALVLLYMGRLSYVKGLDIGIKGFASIARNNKKIYWIIAGRDEGILKDLQLLAKELEVSDQIIFTGNVEGDTRDSLYRIADIYIQISRGEGFSMSILEACSYSIPVIISKDCHFDDISKVNCGKIVELEPLKVEEAITDILNQDDLRLFGRRARKLVEDKYVWKKVANKMIECYQN